MLLNTAGDGNGADASKAHEGNASLGFSNFSAGKGLGLQFGLVPTLFGGAPIIQS